MRYFALLFLAAIAPNAIAATTVSGERDFPLSSGEFVDIEWTFLPDDAQNGVVTMRAVHSHPSVFTYDAISDCTFSQQFFHPPDLVVDVPSESLTTLRIASLAEGPPSSCSLRISKTQSSGVSGIVLRTPCFEEEEAYQCGQPYRVGEFADVSVAAVPLSHPGPDRTQRFLVEVKNDSAFDIDPDYAVVRSTYDTFAAASAFEISTVGSNGCHILGQQFRQYSSGEYSSEIIFDVPDISGGDDFTCSFEAVPALGGHLGTTLTLGHFNDAQIKTSSGGYVFAQDENRLRATVAFGVAPIGVPVPALNIVGQVALIMSIFLMLLAALPRK